MPPGGVLGRPEGQRSGTGGKGRSRVDGVLRLGSPTVRTVCRWDWGVGENKVETRVG